MTDSASSSPCLRRRLHFLGHAAGTIGVGLAVHLGGHAFPDRLRDATGDALWAAMIVFGVGALFPRMTMPARTWLSLAVCYAVECSQLLHTPWLDTLRASRAGHLVLGSGFDGRDLLAYAVGVALAAAYAQRFISTCDDCTP